MKPFRWDITKWEQLGQLVDGGRSMDAYPEFISDLRKCATRVVAFAGDANLAFVGRSPESIFDYLSGLYLDTRWHARLALANVSMRFMSPETIDAAYPNAMDSAKQHFAAIGLAPGDIIAGERPIAIVDLVATGSTLENIASLIVSWTRESSMDVPAVKKKIQFVGITRRKKTSPNTFRWQQHADWLSEFPSGCVKNVSVPNRFWDYLGNTQMKVGRSNPPSRWSDPEILQPPHRDRNLAALNLALTVFDTARSAQEKDLFRDELRKQPQMNQPWFRSIVSQL